MEFTIRTVRICQSLMEEQKESMLSKRPLCSGTSIGDNIREAVQRFSRRDFIYKKWILV